MYKIYLLISIFIFTSCSKKVQVKYTVLEEHKTTTYVLLKKRLSKMEITEIAKEFISNPKNKNKMSICFFLKKNDGAFAIVYFNNNTIFKTIYPFNQRKFDKFFNIQIDENIINHWELKNSSNPRQVFIYKKENQLFYKTLIIDFYSEKLCGEYNHKLINIDTLKNGEIKFQLDNNDSLRYYLIDKEKNLKTFYKNKLTDIIYHKTK